MKIEKDVRRRPQYFGLMPPNRRPSGIASWLPDQSSRALAAACISGSGLKACAPSMPRSSANLMRARLTRLLIVPTAQPQILAASS
jgi:hypothetical protein